jgi:carbon storage regulator
MLILTRKKDESIVIGDNIEIKIISSEDGKVRIGIEAPRDIEIHRREVYDAIQEENRKAVAVKKIDIQSFKKAFKKE